jgi:hypothetical protein
LAVNQASLGGRPRRKRLAPVDVDRNAATGTLRPPHLMPSKHIMDGDPCRTAEIKHQLAENVGGALTGEACRGIPASPADEAGSAEARRRGGIG